MTHLKLSVKPKTQITVQGDLAENHFIHHAGWSSKFALGQ